MTWLRARLLRPRLSLEDGFVAGAESLIFGVLVFVFGTLIVANGWRVVDAKFATNAAAREAVRAAVEAPVGGDLAGLADSAARQAVTAHGYDTSRLSVTATSPLTQTRCAPVRFDATLAVDVAFLPWFGGRTRYDVTSTYEEVIDPFRSGLASAGEAPCDF